MQGHFRSQETDERHAHACESFIKWEVNKKINTDSYAHTKNKQGNYFQKLNPKQVCIAHVPVHVPAHVHVHTIVLYCGLLCVQKCGCSRFACIWYVQYWYTCVAPNMVLSISIKIPHGTCLKWYAEIQSTNTFFSHFLKIQKRRFYCIFVRSCDLKSKNMEIQELKDPLSIL